MTKPIHLNTIIPEPNIVSEMGDKLDDNNMRVEGICKEGMRPRSSKVEMLARKPISSELR